MYGCRPKLLLVAAVLRSVNIELQKTLTPGGEPRIKKFGTAFAVGDKVMQAENDYDKEV